MPKTSEGTYTPERLRKIAKAMVRAASDLKDLASTLELHGYEEFVFFYDSALKKAESGLPKFILDADKQLQQAIDDKKKKRRGDK
jgi:hypothetical protein